METDKPVILETETLKLTRNSRGYNWDIKLLSVDIDKLEQLNNDMIKRFGTGTPNKEEFDI